MSKPRPDRADAAPTKLTDLARPRPRTTQSFFVVRVAILIKRQLFLTNSAILTHILREFLLSYFARVNSIILVISTIFYCYSAQSFLVLQCWVIFCCHTAKSFLNAHCSVIFHCYSAQPFFTATVLNHSSCKRSSVIFWCYSTQSFFIATTSVISRCYSTQPFPIL
jgi:hypothetical protein